MAPPHDPGAGGAGGGGADGRPFRPARRRAAGVALAALAAANARSASALPGAAARPGGAGAAAAAFVAETLRTGPRRSGRVALSAAAEADAAAPRPKRRKKTAAGGDSDDEDYDPGAAEDANGVIVLDDSDDEDDADFVEEEAPPTGRKRRTPASAKKERAAKAKAQKQAERKAAKQTAASRRASGGSAADPVEIGDSDEGDAPADDPHALSTALEGELGVTARSGGRAAAATCGPPPQAEQPKDLLLPLLPFQREFLAWALAQEAGEVKGGVLADEMGMGKTLQSIALVLSNRGEVGAETQGASTSAGPAATKGKGKGKGKASAFPVRNPTLVVCPTVAIIQWRGEIARYVAPGAAKVLLWHGSTKTLDPDELRSADFVLTTYGTLEAEYRKHLMPEKVTCTWCNKKYYPDKLPLHLKYFCGPMAERTAAQAKQERGGGHGDDDDEGGGRKGKKVNWARATSKAESAKLENMMKRAAARAGLEVKGDAEKGKAKGKTKGKGKAADPKGKGKAKGKRKADEADEDDDDDEDDPVNKAVMDLLACAAKVAARAPVNGGGDSSKSVMHSVHWHRVILDEAHAIKDRSCNTAQSVFNLRATYRWALSGTPLQNRVGELYSIVRFLRADPYAFYFCKKCAKEGKECKSLWEMGPDGNCRHCGCHKFNHWCWWNRKVSNPIKYHGYAGKGADAMNLLRDEVLPATLLRRTKAQRADDLALPPRQTVVRRLAMDSREKDFYEALYTQSQARFNTFVSGGTVLNNYAHIFDLLVRLRQSVCHPYLVVHSATNRASSEDADAAAAPSESAPAALCGICYDAADDPVTTACGHAFCRACIQGMLEMHASQAGAAGPAKCPTCSNALSVDLSGADAEDSPGKRGGKGKAKAAPAQVASSGRARKSIMTRVGATAFQSSTKIEALREELFEMKRIDPSAKAIVFSQFTSMLELMQHRLTLAGLTCLRLDGSMSLKKRDEAIDRFTNDPDVSVFFLSLKAGGVALNLTAASHVFLMDPWWNPAVEQQANDRIHRLGQYKPIKCVRIIIAGTIEERIIALQDKKRMIFEATVGRDDASLGKLTAEDMAFLFS